MNAPYLFSGHMVKGQDHTAGVCTNVFYSISIDPLHLKVAKLCEVYAFWELFPGHIFKCHSQYAGFCTTVVAKYLWPIHFEVAKLATVDAPRE